MAQKSKPLILLEYAAVRGLMALFRLLPMPVALAVGRAIGTLWWLVDARHRRVATDNIERALGDELSAPERRRLVRRVFQHFATIVPEIAKASQVIQSDSFDRHFEFENLDAIDRALALGKGVILVTGHIGNWEVLGMVTSLKGYDLTTIARQLDNPKLDALINRERERYGQEIVAKQGALRAMVSVLKRRGILTFVVDQNARESHVFVEFFGRPAATVRSVAALALRAETPIVFGVSVRQGPGLRYKVMVDDPIFVKNTGDKDGDVQRLTQDFTRRLERRVREYPEQWLWLHRRWKTQPEPQTANPPNESE